MAAPIRFNMSFRNIVTISVNTRFYSKPSRNPANTAIKMIRKHERNLAKIQERNEPKKKKKWHIGNVQNYTQVSGSSNTPSAGSQRRAKQLSVILSDHVHNIFTQEHIAPGLDQYGFEVLEAKITPDFNNINVYWNATGNIHKDAELEADLEKCKGPLRSILAQRRIIGRIPPIQFVRDPTESRMRLVEHLLDIADMGPGHMSTAPVPRYYKPSDTPTPDNKKTQQDHISRLTSNFHLHKNNQDGVDFGDSSSHFSEDKEEDCSESASSEKEVDERADPLWDVPLRSDIYEVDHDKLMLRILRNKNRVNQRKKSSESVPQGQVNVSQTKLENLLLEQESGDGILVQDADKQISESPHQDTGTIGEQKDLEKTDTK